MARNLVLLPRPAADPELTGGEHADAPDSARATWPTLSMARGAVRKDVAGRAAAHIEVARLAEEAGDLAAARAELALALEADGFNVEALERSAELSLEAGDERGGLMLLERRLLVPGASAEQAATLVRGWARLGLRDRAEAAVEMARLAGLDTAPLQAALDRARHRPPAPEAPPGPEYLLPSDEDVVRFLSLFGGREDVYARQWWSHAKAKGGYSPVHEPLTPRVLRQHFMGDTTLGVYVIRLDQTARFAVVDIDVRQEELELAMARDGRADELRRTLESFTAEAAGLLAEVGLDPLVERSGYKGRHLWLLFTEPQPASVLHKLGALTRAVLESRCPGQLSVEIFPKQPRRDTRKGLGNLVKLPLGIHRRTGKRSCLHDERGQPCASPFELLRRWPRIGADRLHRAVGEMAQREAALPQRARRDSSPDAGADEPPAALAAPPDVPPTWTAADFDADPDVSHLLARCEVLGAIRDCVERHGRLSHEEQIVLRHTLGHLPTGRLAVNYLLQRAANVAPSAHLQSKLEGNPISCPKIRARVGHIAGRVACWCDFPFAPDHYPTPLLHLRDRPTPVERPRPPVDPEAAVGPDAETQARRYLQLERRLSDLTAQLQSQAQTLRGQIEALPGRALMLGEGELRLEERDGAVALVWHPAGASGSTCGA